MYSILMTIFQINLGQLVVTVTLILSPQLSVYWHTVLMVLWAVHHPHNLNSISEAEVFTGRTHFLSPN